jgi:hypothetical protein
LLYPRNSFSFYTLLEVFLMPQFPRIFLAFLVSLCLSVSSVSAFDTPLSDEAIREAYFLGQRHDGSLAAFLGKYIKQLPPPQTGPYISSVAFFTPFAQLVQISDHYIGNYSAQQAALDHRGQAEFVHIVVEIQLTPTYGAYLAPVPNSRSSSQEPLIPRPQDFWRDFQVRISDDDHPLTPSDFHGKANYNCGRYGYPCYLAGATLEFDLPADLFASGSATIDVTPPDGDPVSVDFDLARLR